MRIILAFQLVSLLCAASFCDVTPKRGARAPRLLADLPADGTSVAYLGRTLTREKYEAAKEAELVEMKKEVALQFTGTFRYRLTKYFNIACICGEAELNSIEQYLTVFFNTIYPRYFRLEPMRPWRIVYFQNRAD